MTTIAFKDGIMACDSCWTDANGWHGTSMTKITRLASGALLGDAGAVDNRALVALLDRVKSFAQMPTARELADTHCDTHAIVAFPNGEVAQVMIEHCKDVNGWTGATWPVNIGGTSVGSGSGVAMGAMDAGWTAAKAVTNSCRRDPNSKLPVHTVAVRPVPPRRRRKKATS